jgi:hypothetical protein
MEAGEQAPPRAISREQRLCGWGVLLKLKLPVISVRLGRDSGPVNKVVST